MTAAMTPVVVVTVQTPSVTALSVKEVKTWPRNGKEGLYTMYMYCTYCILFSLHCTLKCITVV